jgi:hypothetical protein
MLEDKIQKQQETLKFASNQLSNFSKILIKQRDSAIIQNIVKEIFTNGARSHDFADVKLALVSLKNL